MKKIYLLNLLVIFAFILKAQDYKMIEKNLHLKEMQKRELLTKEKMQLQEIEQEKFLLEEIKKQKDALKSKTTKSSISVSANEQDSLVLVTFYNSTNGNGWTDNENWLTGNVETWKGITLDADGRVTEIYLRSNNLTGALPVEIGDLTNLTELWLYYNNIGGEIPAEIGNLNNLERLALLSNNLSGNIPDEIGNLTNLIALGIADNQFTDLPDLSSLTSLGYFYINDNNFDFGDFEATGLTFSNIFASYSPQANVALTRTDDAGNITFSVSVDGTNNTYQWYKDDVAILGENSNTLTVADTETGIYYCTITDTNYPDLTLYTVSEGVNVDLTNGIYTEEYNALVAIYNATGGDNWTYNTNWITNEPAANWAFVTVEGAHVTNLIFDNNNNFSGDLPAEIGDLPMLEALYIGWNNQSNLPAEVSNLTELTDLAFNGNNITDIPDLSNLSNLASLYANDNKLTFEDIEPNIGVASDYFNYSPQANVGEEQEYTLAEGESKTISVTVGGDNNTYQWYKDNVAISGATSDTYEITDFASADAGVYVCKINNTVATDLELVSNNITLNETTVNVEDVSNNFVIYPNPTNSILNIKFEQDDIKSIQIVDLTGKVLLNKLKVNKFETFDISNLDNGIYFIIIKSDNNILTSKIVKN